MSDGEVTSSVSTVFECPSCKARSMGVVDCRPYDLFSLTAIKRRRKCLSCNHRITTFEVTQDQLGVVSDRRDFLFVRNRLEEAIGRLNMMDNSVEE